MRLNSICTILLLTFYLIVPTNGILHLLFHALSQSVPHGLTPDQLFNKLSSSEGIQNAIRNKFNVQQLSSTLQNESQKLGINLPSSSDFEKTLETKLQNFQMQHPEFNLEELKNFDFNSFRMSQVTNAHIVEVELDFYKPLNEWKTPEILTWWKYNLINTCLVHINEKKVNGKDLSNPNIFNIKFINTVLDIKDELIQEKILREVKDLKNDIHINRQYRSIQQEETENDEMTYDKLSEIKRYFYQL